ncbi:MAG: polysaccharide export protein, partial [Alphaproteobacteria bacterium]|nr:polysaccharide export protein [Alphaproteobacteria bacterium]
MLTRRTGTIALAAGLATFLAACQSGTVVDNRSTSSPAAQARVVMDYQLGSGDQIKVTVFGHEDLSGQFEIDGSGAISMPLIGQISAIGQTTQSLEQAITAKLSDG